MKLLWGRWNIYTFSSFPHSQSMLSVCVAINFSGYVNPSNNLPSEYLYISERRISFDGIQVGEHIYLVYSLCCVILFFVEQQWEKNWAKLLNFCICIRYQRATEQKGRFIWVPVETTAQPKYSKRTEKNSIHTTKKKRSVALI